MVEPGGGCLPTNLSIPVSRSWRQESDNNTYLLPIQFHYCESQHKCYSHAHTYTRARRTHTHARCILIYKQSQKLSCAHTRAYYKEYIYAGAHTHTHAPRSVRIYTVYITTILGQSTLDNIENRQQLPAQHTPTISYSLHNMQILSYTSSVYKYFHYSDRIISMRFPLKYWFFFPFLFIVFVLQVIPVYM